MPRSIYLYEVEIKVTVPTPGVLGPGTSKLVVRQEHAYSVPDAVMQATYTANADNPGATDIRLIRVGPPVEAIRQAEEESRAVIDELKARLTAAMDKASADAP